MTFMRKLARLGRSHRMVPLGRITIVVQGLLALAFVAYLLSNQGVRLPWNASTDTVEAVFSDAAGLNAGDEPTVLVAGVDVGKVSDVRYERGRAVVTLAIEDEHARGLLRSDARAQILPRSSLNDLEVDVDPGSAESPLAEGERIPERRTESAVQLDEVIATLDSDTRAWAQVLLGELRTGLRGKTSELASALRELGRVTEPTADVSAALAQRRRLLARLIGDLDVIFRALGDRGIELAATIRTGRQTLDVTAARGAELSETFRALPDTLASLDRALRAVGQLSVPLDPALERLGPVAERLPGALGSLRRFVPTGRELVNDLGPLTADGREPARELRRLLGRLGPASGSLAPSVRNLQGFLQAIDDNKEGIAPLGENFSGVFSTNDPNGPILRGLGYFEAFRCENFGFSGEMFPDCGPPPGAAGSQAGAPAGVEPAQLVLRALAEVCHGGDRVARNRAACLPIYYAPELVRELPHLPERELEKVRAELAFVLPGDRLEDLRRDVAGLLPRAQVARVLPSRSRVYDIWLAPLGRIAGGGR